ncbi:hypothetical protein HDV04_005747 [Boothiomyces sp. JEL0838]|nr:hypothetical protein HDV04_005747 [Boothiomyces sp. JEL0838]
MDAYSFVSPQKSLIRFANQINGYDLKEVIGKGGFGIVYRAISKSSGSLGKQVAIKLINKLQMKKANLTKRVANEVEIHWQLRHSSILELYNYFEDSEYVYLVMEYCSNGNMYEYLQSVGYLKEEKVRRVMEQLVDGLLYLHSNGIIHRDLKLSNLLLTDCGNLKIADFGLAVKLSDPDGEQKTMCGTPNYISPEIVSRNPYGLSSDVWAVGCLMVTLLTGSPPFQDAAVKNTLDKVSRVEYTLPDFLSREAKDLINNMLQKDPKKRLLLTEIQRHDFFKRPFANITSQYSNKSNIERPFKSRPIIDVNSSNILDPLNNTPIREKMTLKSHSNRTPKMSLKSTPYSQSNNSEMLKSVSPKSVTEFQYFTTERLSPLIQKTKYGTVEILKNLNLLLDFSGDEELMVILSDGSLVLLFSRQHRANLEPGYAKQSYTVSNLPSKFHKKLRYACRFVDLVRSKTPKIIFYSPQAKCTLMENKPTPDFDMNFFNQIRIHSSGSTKTLVIKIPQNLISQYPTQNAIIKEGSLIYQVELKSNDFNIDPYFKELFKHAQECLRHCMGIEQESTNAKYPIIIKSNSQYNRYIIDKDLPKIVKQKLVYFPKFVELFRSNM